MIEIIDKSYVILSLEVQTVQSSERSEILLCLQAKKVACHNLMDSSRRHGVLVSETKDFITAQQAL